MERNREHKSVRLTASEWTVLSCLWERSPQTVMQLVAELNEQVSWAKSTTITVLRRMEEKGLLYVQAAGRGKAYTPAIGREQAVVEETRSFLDRVYQGSIGLMMSTMAQRQELSQEEIRQLQEILDRAEEERR